MAKQAAVRQLERDEPLINLDERSRALLAKQSEALAKVAFARAEFEQVKAELYRAAIDHIFIEYW